nr:MAG TPA: hypothetical protein [Caudoviricetes sp.]
MYRLFCFIIYIRKGLNAKRTVAIRYILKKGNYSYG